MLCSIVRSLPLTPAFWSLALSRFEYAKTTRGGEERFVVIVNEGELADYLVGHEPELHVDKSINSWGVFAMPPPRPPPLPRHWVRPAETTLNPAPSSPIANVVYIYTKQHMAHELAREFGAKYDADGGRQVVVPPAVNGGRHTAAHDRALWPEVPGGHHRPPRPRVAGDAAPTARTRVARARVA